MAIFGNHLNEKDYFIVGEEIYVSKTNHPVSELELESKPVAQACRRILAGYGVPIFRTWIEFEAQDGLTIIEAFRKHTRPGHLCS